MSDLTVLYYMVKREHLNSALQVNNTVLVFQSNEVY